jgi:restriction system protein
VGFGYAFSLALGVGGLVWGVEKSVWWAEWTAMVYLSFTLFVAWSGLTARRKRVEHERACRAAGLDQIDAMSGLEFEDYVATVLESAGYDVSFTKATGDFGVDLVLSRDGVRTAVQCKRNAGPVGGSAVQQVVAGAPMHDCARTMVVSNNAFTRAARQLADTHDCELVDRSALEQLALTVR